MTALEHLREAEKILRKQHDEAKDRYERQDRRIRKSRKIDDSLLRYAWYEYTGLRETLDAIDAAIAAYLEAERRLVDTKRI